MTEDEDRAVRPASARRDLVPLSLAELEAYIGELEGEIARARREIAAKRRQRGGAELLFKR